MWYGCCWLARSWRRLVPPAIDWPRPPTSPPACCDPVQRTYSCSTVQETCMHTARAKYATSIHIHRAGRCLVLSLHRAMRFVCAWCGGVAVGGGQGPAGGVGWGGVRVAVVTERAVTCCGTTGSNHCFLSCCCCHANRRRLVIIAAWTANVNNNSSTTAS